MAQPPEPPDAVLVRRSRQGDARSFSILVERYMRGAYAVALSVTRDHADAEDVVQEAFMVALKRLEECRDPERFGGWLITIVRNRGRNLLRREGLRTTEEIPPFAATADPGPDRDAERSHTRRLLRRAIGDLPEVQREVVLLHDLEGWKHREIAERLGIPSGTVRSHLHHARKALRKALGDTLGPRGREEGST